MGRRVHQLPLLLLLARRHLLCPPPLRPQDDPHALPVALLHCDSARIHVPQPPDGLRRDARLHALALALSNPCMELLYQPTSSEVKFKVKTWIDKFGQGGVKALGSVFIYQFS